ncbi:MAG: TIGR02453 family protein [Actinophytocola sp.]|nr:TIGR02453 family protein [Actinophytocola sp.]
MAFTGFGEAVVDFYDGLLADNSKAYWEDNLDVYRRDIRAPMEALLADLEVEFGPDFGMGKVFRPHRDVRFAKDKSPYKTHCGAVIEAGRGGGAYYVEVSSEGMMVGGGCFHLQSDQIARFRQVIDTDLHGPELERIVATLRESGWEIKGEQLKTKPRGYSDDHPRIDLLRHKSLYAVQRWEPDDTLHEPACLDRVRQSWREVRDFNAWAADHVGVSEQPRRR